MTEYLREHSAGQAPPHTLKELRKASGITQRALAEAQGVSVPAVCRWEDGTARPSIDRLPALARSLGVTVDELVAALIVAREAAS